MAQANVDIVARVYEAVRRDDTDAVLALYAEDVEWDFSRSPFRDFLTQTVYRGHEGMRAFIRERYHEAWRDIEDDVDELVDAGDRVVTIVTTHGRGRASGAAVDRTHAGVWTIRDGAIVHVAWYGTREDALDAVGLVE